MLSVSVRIPCFACVRENSIGEAKHKVNFRERRYPSGRSIISK
jgi:hypothetical protein